MLRPLLLLFWAFVGWGTLLLFGLAWSLLTKGPGTTLRATAPRPQDGLLGWLNLLAPACALAVWALVVAFAGRPRSAGRVTGGGPGRGTTSLMR